MLTRFLLIFFILTMVGTFAVWPLKLNSNPIDYWETHGLFLIFFLSFFPRLTLLFSSIPLGGFLWWLGFIFCPRYLVAIIATIAYWTTNPILVSFSWLLAIGGETSEKYFIQKNVYRRYNNSRNEDAIEVESRRID